MLILSIPKRIWVKMVSNIKITQPKTTHANILLMWFRSKAIYMFQQEISQLNLQQLKAGEKRWVGNLQGSSASLLFIEIVIHIN